MPTKDKGRKRPDGGMMKNRPFPYYWIYLILFIGILLFYFHPGKSSGRQEITWQLFKQEMLLNHDVEKVNILNKEVVDVYIKFES